MAVQWRLRQSCGGYGSAVAAAAELWRPWQCSVLPAAEAVAVSVDLAVAGSVIDSPPPAAICHRIIAGSDAICPLAATDELGRYGSDNETTERKRMNGHEIKEN